MSIDADHAHDLCFGDFTLVRADERLVGPAGPVKLGRKAFQVLLRLAEQKGQLLTKDALFETVWDGMIVSESALTSVIKELRRALGDQSVDPRYIESVYGRGYRLLPEVTCRPASAPLPPASSVAAADPDSRRMGEAPLLVVPAFDDAAIRDTDPHLGAVLHEEVLIALSRFRDIRLVSDAGLPGGRGQFGERDYQLAVRLVRAGDDIRAFARIARLSSGAIIWAEQMSMSVEHRMQGVEDMARRVAVVALPRLHDDMLRNLPRRLSGPYDHYFVARLRMRGLDSVEEARDVAQAWERLIADHPALVQAYPPLIRLYNTDFGFTGPGATDEGDRRRAYALAHQAITLDPTDSHLHAVKGWCHLWAGEAALANRHFEEAATLNPYHQARLIELATGFMFLEEFDRAEQLLDRCRALSAFVSEAPHEEEGLLHLLREDYPRAAAALALARRTHPDDVVRTRPSLLTEFYALLAAAGAEAPDAARRAKDWHALVQGRWAGAEPCDPARLKTWAAFHNPFQRAERRAWLHALMDRALDPPGPASRRTGAPARRGTPSARPRPAPAGS